MNNPTPTPEASPIKPVVAPVPLKKLNRGADKQQNRQIGHMVKAASMHRAMPARSMSHSRGR